MRPLMMRALKLLLTAAVILGMAPTNMAFLPAVTRRGNAQLVPAGKRAPQVPARGRGQASLQGGRHARRWLRPSLAVATAETGDPLPSSAGTVTPLLYDATLTQRQVDFGAEDKIKVAQMLSDFGMDYIEAGWPTCSAADRVFFIRALDQLTPECIGKLVAMAPLPSEGDAKGPDAVSEALLESGVPNVGVALNVAAVAPVSAAFLAGIGGPVAENLSAVLTHLRAGQGSHRKTVVVHMHNAMHAYRTNAASVTAVASAACSSGADVVLLIDSGGTATPWEIETMLAELQRTVQWGATKLGVSCMEHAELSVASTIYAAKQGANVLAGSINGFGGCADLATVVPILQLKMGHALVTSLALAGLTRLSRAIDEQANLPHRNNQPFVGMSAFAHKGGIHVAAVLKNEDSYQHIDPTLVGNQRRVLISELSGRGNIMSKVEEFGMLGQQSSRTATGVSSGAVELGSEQNVAAAAAAAANKAEWKKRSGEILKSVKDLEQKGYTFEGAEASVDLMIRRSMADYVPAFVVQSYQVVHL